MSEELVVVPPVQGEADVMIEAQALDISGPETMELAIELRESIKALLNEIDGAFRPHIARANALHKGLCGELSERGRPVRAALDVITGKIAGYEVARRQAEERERQANAEAQAREAAEAREREAQAAAVYSPQQAADVRAMPLDTFIAPSMAPTRIAPKTKGVAVTQSYAAELVDLKALADYAVAHPEMLALVLAPNQPGLDALVKQMGESFNIPGVRRVPKAPSVRSTAR